MPSTTTNNGNHGNHGNNENSSSENRNSQIIQLNEIEKLNEMNCEEEMEENKTFKQLELPQISENNSVNNENSEYDFICSPGEYIVILGPIQKNIMKKCETDLNDNSLKLTLNEQEINSKIGFWKSEFRLLSYIS